MKNQFIKLLTRNFIFCDVGARWGLEEPWKSYRNHLDVVSFEPDQEEYENLEKKKMDGDIVLPYALSSGEKKLNLHLTKNRACSSIIQPNHSYLKRFPDVERFSVEEKQIVESTTLDTLYEKNIVENIDFIKLDIQGFELDVLKGGGEIS